MSQCADIPWTDLRKDHCLPTCGEPCFHGYILNPSLHNDNTSSCLPLDYGCNCARADYYRDAMCCALQQCPDTSGRDNVADFLAAFCDMFDPDDQPFTRATNCSNWTAPPSPSIPSASPDTTNPGRKESDLKVGLGAGIGGGVGGLLLVGLGGYFFWRRRKRVKAAPGVLAPPGGDGPSELGGRAHMPTRHEMDVVRGPGDMWELGGAYLPPELEGSVKTY